MRIGIDGRLWNETGVGRYLRNLVENLQEIDKTNEYVLFVRPSDAKNGKLQMVNGKWKIVSVDIRWHTIEEQLNFPKILYKENLELVHFPYFSVPIFYNKPYIVTIHDLILNHFPTGKASTLPWPRYQLKRVGYDFVLSTALKNARKIIVPLNTVKDDLVKTMNVSVDKIVVTYEGIDRNLESRIKNQDLSSSKYFLYVGNAYPHKNLERLIKAFSEFRKQEKNIEILLVGKKDYFYKRLSEKVEKEKIQGIIFRHDVSDTELGKLYQNALAVVLPSLMEGFGLPALEAMACSCLVLASDIPSFREVCSEAAVYFDPYAISDIEKKLIHVCNLENKDKYEYVKKGLERVKQFSWRKMAEETLKIYNSVLRSE